MTKVFKRISLIIVSYSYFIIQSGVLLGEEKGSPPDAVIFFDANMPKMDRCSNNCSNKDLVLCVHRFACRVYPDHPGKALESLDDFHVIQHFFDRIRKDWQSAVPKPLFFLITKDEDFLEVDAPEAYREAVKARKNKINIFFGEKSVSDGMHEIFILEMSPKKYGKNRNDNLRCTIQEFNKLWLSLKNNPE